MHPAPPEGSLERRPATKLLPQRCCAMPPPTAGRSQACSREGHEHLFARHEERA